MPVFRIERTRDYTVMSNHHLKNPELSLKAKGLLSMMLSFPDGWNYSERGLASICKEGVDAIHSAIKELESTGYMERHQLRGKGGRIVDTEYVIYEKPHTPDMAPPDTENPDMDSPDMVLPDAAPPDAAAPETGNPGELNKNPGLQTGYELCYIVPTLQKGVDRQWRADTSLVEERHGMASEN